MLGHSAVSSNILRLFQNLKQSIFYVGDRETMKTLAVSLKQA